LHFYQEGIFLKKKTWLILAGSFLFLLVALTVTLLLIQDEEEPTHWDLLNAQYVLANEDAEDGQIVFLGDSITEGFDVDAFLASSLILYNRGIGGDTTEGILRRLDSNVLTIHPSVIVLLIGINDIHTGVSVAGIESNLIAICLQIQSALPDCYVYIESLYPTNDSMLAYLPDYWETIAETNVRIQAVCGQFGYTYVNVHDFLLAGEELNRSYSGDGLHLNSAGYEIVSAILALAIPELEVE
jgi:lysophospholipase L1-like esterase